MYSDATEWHKLDLLDIQTWLAMSNEQFFSIWCQRICAPSYSSFGYASHGEVHNPTLCRATAAQMHRLERLSIVLHDDFCPLSVRLNHPQTALWHLAGRSS